MTFPKILVLGILTSAICYFVLTFCLLLFKYFRLELLQTLTEYGKDILHLEERMGPFLLEWMPTITAGDGKRGAEFLSLLVNVIKFNSAYIDDDIISGLVQ